MAVAVVGSREAVCGYYDYEQIHDDLAMHAAMVYDFAFDYLSRHPHAHLKEIGKDTKSVAVEVFKRFINIGLVRGGKSGNWNVNGWKYDVASRTGTR